MAYLRLRDVSIDFPVYHGGSRSLKKSILASTTRGNLAKDVKERVTVHALDSINLNIEKGHRLALIGPNGSGKTTLLKTLAGIYEPTHGAMMSEGKVYALLDAAVGLNPDSTGYENMYLRGMFMGIRPSEMTAYVEEIAEFTELGSYLDMPVRTYSAGMMIRLAFATATCLPPDVLLMDEWLAAGDASFLQKAQNRMENFVKQSSILVLASHTLSLLEKWCDRAIFLYQGKILAEGDVASVWREYEKTVGF